MKAIIPDNDYLIHSGRIQYVYDNGEVSDTIEVRLGELPKLIDSAFEKCREEIKLFCKEFSEKYFS